MKRGYIHLWRKYFDHPFWKEKRPRTKWEAWLDLVALAAGKDKQVVFRGEYINLKRGQIIVSERFLATRWKWDRGTAHRFLAFCLDEGMIYYHRKNHRITIINILNYTTYNPWKRADATTESTTDPTTDATTDPTTTKKEVKKDIKKEIKKYTAEFENFWIIYPRKREKEDAFVTWGTLTKVQQEEILLAVPNYKEETKLLKTEERYIKHAKTFLNPKKKRWKDFLPGVWTPPLGIDPSKVPYDPEAWVKKER